MGEKELHFDIDKNLVLRAIRQYCEPEEIKRLAFVLAKNEHRMNNAPLIYKLRFFIALCQADAVLVRDVLAILPEAKRRFFLARYRDKVPITFLAPKLHLSPKQLGTWHKEIFELLRDLLRGLASERVLSPEKLSISMRHLDALLAVADEDGGIADQAYMAMLHKRRARLEETQNRLTAYLDTLQNTAERNAVADWMRDSSMTYVELSFAHHISEASARRYILRFRQAVQDEGKG